LRAYLSAVRARRDELARARQGGDIVKALACLMASLCAMAPAIAQAQGARPSKQVPVVRGYPATADVTMRLYVPAGRVRITVWPRDSVHVKGTTGAGVTVFGGGSRTHMKFGIESKEPGDSLPDADPGSVSASWSALCGSR
jgi:hypothetical protein